MDNQNLHSEEKRGFLSFLRNLPRKLHALSAVKPEDRAVIKKSLLRQNLWNCLGTSFMLCFFSFAGLVGTFAPLASGGIFSKINATMAYSTIFGMNFVFFLLFLGGELRGKTQLARYSRISSLFYFLNMFISPLTFLTTQKGSSYFFEFILITLLIYLFPIHEIGETTGLFAVNITVFVIVSKIIGWHYAWQDLFDLAVLHVFCVVVSVFRWNAFFHDVTLQNNLENVRNELYGQSRMDALTGLQNRTALRDDFPSAVGTPLCVALLDVDFFKQINDTYGHYYGDKVLSFLGRTLREVFSRPGDRCYRYGGDEMLIISREQDPERFRTRLKGLQELCGDEAKNGFRLSLSIGYCCGTPDSESELRQCIRTADASLYEVKKTKKGEIRGVLLEQAAQSAGERKEGANARLKLLSYDDLQHRFEEISGQREGWSLVYFDICHFSEIDERFGFQMSKWVLEKVEGLIQGAFPEDLLSNPEIDHLILFSFQPEQDIRSRVESIQREAASVLPHWMLRLRAGVFRCAPEWKGISFLHAVNNAQYAEVSLLDEPAEGSIRFYSMNLEHKKNREIFFRSHLQEAIEKGQIIPRYQPVLESFSEKCVGFSAVSRWVDPEKGEFLPEEYIPFLVRIREVQKLELYVLSRVCREMQNLADSSPDICKSADAVPCFISVRIYSLGDEEGFADKIDETVSGFSIPKNRICLEIARPIPNSTEIFRREIRTLAQKGYQIWMNRCRKGTPLLDILEDSSLGGVLFSGDLLEERQKNIRFRALNDLVQDACRELDIRVIAGDIGDQRQLWAARQFGADWVKGSLFADDMPVEKLGETVWVRNFLSVEEDRYFGEIKRINLRNPAARDRGWNSSGQTVVVACGIMESSEKQLRMIRMNNAMQRVMQPCFADTDLPERIRVSEGAGKEILQSIEKNRLLKGQKSFHVVISGVSFLAVLEFLAEDQAKNRQAWLLTLTNADLR